MKAIAASVGLLALVMIGPPSHALATAPKVEECAGGATPAKTYRAFTDAANRNDWRAAYRYVFPEARDGLYAKLVAGLIVASAFDDNKERRADLDRILRKHGFKIDRKGRYTQGDRDLSDFVQDWPGLMQKISPYLKRWHAKALVPKGGKLLDVQTDGNQATGTASGAEGPGNKIAFIRTQGRWCLTAD